MSNHNDLPTARCRPHAAWIIAILLLIALVVLADNSPLRSSYVFMSDFGNIYSASRVWLFGGNPYDMPEVYQAWRQARPTRPMAMPQDPDLRNWISVQSPSALLVVSPLAALGPMAAGLTWMVLAVILLIARFPAIFALGDIKAGWQRLIVIAAVVASAPVQEAFGVMQPSLLANSLTLFALWAILRQRPKFGGFLLGLASAIKPQLGGIFVAYYLLIGRPRIVLWALVVAVSLHVAAVLPMELRGIDWWHSWRLNTALSLASGGVNDPTITGPFRHDMIDLTPLLYSLFRSARLVWTINLLVFACLLAGLIGGVRRTADPATDLLCLSAVATIGLLAFYHRLYDATLLVLPLAWAITRLNQQRGLAIAMLCLLATFVIPGQLLAAVLLRTRVFAAYVNLRWWQALLVSQYSWQLLLTALLIVMALLRSAGRNGSRQVTAPPDAGFGYR